MTSFAIIVAVLLINAIVVFIAVTTAYQRGYEEGHHSGWKGAKGPELRPPGEPQRTLPFGITKARH
jgi:hypothetical protein